MMEGIEMENREGPVIRITKPLTTRSANVLVANWQWGQPYFTTMWEDFCKIRVASYIKHGVDYTNYHLSKHECIDPDTRESGYLFIRT